MIDDAEKMRIDVETRRLQRQYAMIRKEIYEIQKVDEYRGQQGEGESIQGLQLLVLRREHLFDQEQARKSLRKTELLPGI